MARRVSTVSRHDMTAVQIHSVPAEWICKNNQNHNTECRPGRKKNEIFPFLQPFVFQYIKQMSKIFLHFFRFFCEIWGEKIVLYIEEIIMFRYRKTELFNNREHFAKKDAPPVG